MSRQHDVITLRGIHVLLVGEDVHRLALFRSVLEYWDALVTACSSSDRALRAMERLRPNVLVVDIERIDGEAEGLMRRVRALPESAGGAIPAIAVVVIEDDAATQRLKTAGFDAHLKKPVPAVELGRAIVRLLGER
jgi:CheY-like chemotaxis protein